MNEVFVPDLVSTFRWMSISLILGLLGIFVAYLSFKRKNFPSRQAVQLLSLFSALIGIMGTVLTFWSLQRSPTVVVTPEYVVLGKDTIQANKLDKAYIEVLTENNFMGQPKEQKVGVLMYKSGKTQLFSEKEYELEKLIKSLRSMLDS